MAKNRLLDHLKREATHQKHLLQLPIADNIPAYADEGLLLKEYHQIALDAINKLSQKQQEVFLLRHREDMTIDEIAAATGSSRAAVQKNLVRAVRFIKQQLVHYGDWALPIIFLLLSVG